MDKEADYEYIENFSPAMGKSIVEGNQSSVGPSIFKLDISSKIFHRYLKLSLQIFWRWVKLRKREWQLVAFLFL